MDEVKIITMKKTTGKWLKLMLNLNNSVPHIFRIVCKDEDSAKKTFHRLDNVIREHPTWFDMVVIRKGSDVYVVKTYFAQKVVIRDA